MITDKEFRKLIDEAPYLLDSSMLPVTRSAAIEAFAENPISPGEFVKGIKTKLPECAWKKYDDALERIWQQENVRTFEHKEAALPLYSHAKRTIFSDLKKHSRLAVASILVIATVSYFTLVPSGKTLALEIAGFVERLFGNRLEVSINERPIEIDGTQPEYIQIHDYSSFEDLPELGIKPFIIDPTIMSVQSIEYEISPTRKLLYATYIDEDNSYVYVTQYWDQADNMSFISNNEEYDILHYGEETVYVNEDAVDGVVDAYIVLKNSVVQITTQNMNQIERILVNIVNGEG